MRTLEADRRGENPPRDAEPSAPGTGPPASSKARWRRVAMAGLAVLIGITSLAVARVNPWFVAPYLVMMGWILLGPRGSSRAAEGEGAPTPGPALGPAGPSPADAFGRGNRRVDPAQDRPGPGPSSPPDRAAPEPARVPAVRGWFARRSKSDAPGLSPDDPPESPGAAADLLPVAETDEPPPHSPDPATPPSKARRRRRKKSDPPEPEAPPTEVVWVRVGANQFVRQEIPLAPPTADPDGDGVAGSPPPSDPVDPPGDSRGGNPPDAWALAEPPGDAPEDAEPPADSSLAPGVGPGLAGGNRPRSLPIDGAPHDPEGPDAEPDPEHPRPDPGDGPGLLDRPYGNAPVDPPGSPDTSSPIHRADAEAAPHPDSDSDPAAIDDDPEPADLPTGDDAPDPTVGASLAVEGQDAPPADPGLAPDSGRGPFEDPIEPGSDDQEPGGFQDEPEDEDDSPRALEDDDLDDETDEPDDDDPNDSGRDAFDDDDDPDDDGPSLDDRDEDEEDEDDLDGGDDDFRSHTDERDDDLDPDEDEPESDDLGPEVGEEEFGDDDLDGDESGNLDDDPLDDLDADDLDDEPGDDDFRPDPPPTGTGLAEGPASEPGDEGTDPNNDDPWDEDDEDDDDEDRWGSSAAELAQSIVGDSHRPADPPDRPQSEPEPGPAAAEPEPEPEPGAIPSGGGVVGYGQDLQSYLQDLINMAGGAGVSRASPPPQPSQPVRPEPPMPPGVAPPELPSPREPEARSPEGDRGASGEDEDDAASRSLVATPEQRDDPSPPVALGPVAGRPEAVDLRGPRADGTAPDPTGVPDRTPPGPSVIRSPAPEGLAGTGTGTGSGPLPSTRSTAPGPPLLVPGTRLAIGRGPGVVLGHRPGTTVPRAEPDHRGPISGSRPFRPRARYHPRAPPTAPRVAPDRPPRRHRPGVETRPAPAPARLVDGTGRLGRDPSPKDHRRRTRATATGRPEGPRPRPEVPGRPVAPFRIGRRLLDLANRGAAARPSAGPPDRAANPATRPGTAPPAWPPPIEVWPVDRRPVRFEARIRRPAPAARTDPRELATR
ncbi:hypothetical protein [Tautonia plasticadhaerens]|nr:hypothetical protein [Tautonia plasticadhaerens]